MEGLSTHTETTAVDAEEQIEAAQEPRLEDHFVPRHKKGPDFSYADDPYRAYFVAINQEIPTKLTEEIEEEILYGSLMLKRVAMVHTLANARVINKAVEILLATCERYVLERAVTRGVIRTNRDEEEAIDVKHIRACCTQAMKYQAIAKESFDHTHTAEAGEKFELFNEDPAETHLSVARFTELLELEQECANGTLEPASSLEALYAAACCILSAGLSFQYFQNHPEEGGFPALAREINRKTAKNIRGKRNALSPEKFTEGQRKSQQALERFRRIAMQFSLCEANFITNIVQHYADDQMPLEDLVQEGLLIFAHVLEVFDLGTQREFFVYVTRSLRSASYLQRKIETSPLTLGRAAAINHGVMTRAERDGRPHDIDPEETKRLQEAVQPAVELHSQSLEKAELIDSLEASVQTPAFYLATKEVRQLVQQVCEQILSPLERVLFLVRHGLTEGLNMESVEVALVLNIDEERVEAIERAHQIRIALTGNENTNDITPIEQIVLILRLGLEVTPEYFSFAALEKILKISKAHKKVETAERKVATTLHWEEQGTKNSNFPKPAQKNAKQGGRAKFTPAEKRRVLESFQEGRINAQEAAAALQMNRGSFYRMARREGIKGGKKARRAALLAAT